MHGGAQHKLSQFVSTLGDYGINLEITKEYLSWPKSNMDREKTIQRHAHLLDKNTPPLADRAGEVRTNVGSYGGLNGTVPYRLRYLNTWTPVGVTVW